MDERDRPAAGGSAAACRDRRRLAELARLQADQKTPAPRSRRAARGDGSAGWARSARWRGSSSSSRWRRSARASFSSSASPRPARSSLRSSLRRVLDGVGRLVRARLRAVDLRARDGARRGAAPLRRRGDAADVRSRVGAFIRLRGRELAPYQNARIGLAGPMWGLGAATMSLAVSRAGGGPLWAAVAHTGAWLNLFNLMPVWQLDGNRGFSALSASARWIVAAGFAGRGCSPATA